MDKPYDHLFDRPLAGVREQKFKNGVGWNLTYEELPCRFGHAKQRIRIGFKCSCPSAFDGRLKVGVTTDDGIRKDRYLPFKVEE